MKSFLLFVLFFSSLERARTRARTGPRTKFGCPHHDIRHHHRGVRDCGRSRRRSGERKQSSRNRNGCRSRWAEREGCERGGSCGRDDGSPEGGSQRTPPPPAAAAAATRSSPFVGDDVIVVDVVVVVVAAAARPSSRLRAFYLRRQQPQPLRAVDG